MTDSASVARIESTQTHGRGCDVATQLRQRWIRALRRCRGQVEAGMTTAEYAVGTLAAVAFAAALIAVVKSDAVRSALARIIQTALSTG